MKPKLLALFELAVWAVGMLLECVFAVILRVRSGVELHGGTSPLQALKLNFEPSAEPVKNTRPLHTEMKVTLYFLGN